MRTAEICQSVGPSLPKLFLPLGALDGFEFPASQSCTAADCEEERQKSVLQTNCNKGTLHNKK